MSRLNTTSLLSLLTASILAGNAAAQAVTLNLSNEYAANSIHGVGDASFAEAVAEETGGEVEIIVHYGGALGYKSADHFDAVGEGALEIANTFGGALGGLDPLFLVSSLPFLVTTVEDARLLYQASEERFREIFDDGDQILLYASPWPPSGLWGRKPMNNRDSLQGVKIRTYDRNGTIALNILGANAITMSWADVVPAISTGAIDAVLSSAEGGVSSSFGDYFNSYTEIYNYAIPLNFVHMNRVIFNDLTESQQEGIMRAAARVNEVIWAAIPDRLEATYQQLADQNITVVASDNEEFRVALQEAGETTLLEWLAVTGEDGQSIIDAFEASRGE
ncbi:TRAP transporter substrate-binding protein [Natronohydrobacter thiooxidans]|uniref:TRAP transporter substrate-binding protein n=1 Tax=Natronohydrobacter thiooxidans TaxID=87172 RepID=UPI000A015562|nr:TRAP transporter substrate-binding protein [Natronohydrobacter thiooxidans]